MILKPLSIENNFDDDSLVYISDNELQYNPGVTKSVIEDIQNRTIQIYNGYYEFNKGWDAPKLYLIGRGKNSGRVKLKIQNFLPYFYMKKSGGEYKTYLGEEVEKLSLKGMHPSRVATFRDVRRRKGFPLPYEADILFVRRFLIDMYDYFKPIEPVKPKVIILDIETNHPINEDIISYAMNYTDGDIYYGSKFDTTYPFELALEIFDKLEEFDIVTGWNIEFDIKAIQEYTIRIDSYLNYAKTAKLYSKEEYSDNMSRNEGAFGKEESIKIVDYLLKKGYLKEENGYLVLGDNTFDPIIANRISIIDMLTISKKMHAREIRGKWNLGNVGVQLVGLDKVNIGARHIRDLSEEELFEYNITDTIIPELIDDILGGIEAHLILAWSLQCIIDEKLLITAVINDIALLRAYHKAGIVLPSRDYKEDEKVIKYDAAEPEAIPGIYNGIIVTDIVHAYPWAVISKNISPETKDKNGENVVKYTNKAGVNKEIRFNNKKSVFIETLKDIMMDRKKVKEKLKETEKNSESWKRLKSIDFALKTQAAAFSHGIFGWTNSRMRDYEVADAITAVVRDLITLVKQACNVIERPWVYAHTDSCFINALKSDESGMIGYLNDIIQDYSQESKVMPELDIKGFYPLAYIHSPARNVLIPEDGDINNVDTWDVTGMNFMRSEVPEELSDIEIELIKLKMKGASIPVLIYRLRRRIRDLIYVDSTRLGLIKPLTKPISKYGKELKDGTHGGVPYHIKALIKANSERGFMVEEGDKFMMLPILTDELVGKKKIRRKRVDMAFDIDEGLPENYKIDYEYYLRSNLFGKVHQLFDMKPKDLEKEIMSDNLIKILKKGGKEVCQPKK